MAEEISDNNSVNNLPTPERPNGERRKSPRPESTMALDFSEALDGAFNLGGELPDLTQAVESKKQTVTDQSKELEELKARIEAAEARLKNKPAKGPAASGQLEGGEPASSSSNMAPPTRAPPVPGGAAAAIPSRMKPNSGYGSSVADRVPTPMDPSRNGGMPGAMPETPGSMKDAKDYYSQQRA
ncbi:MAG: hypothetical protein M1831_001407 [Alyxoria varia]|nr:MAG: hypothetical protein M1831_001407 [Alyxoria varia]